MSDRLSKPVLRVLEKCFEAEIEGMPAQFPRGQHLTINGIRVGAAVARANSDGLIEQVDHPMAFNDGLPPMLIRGFVLTPRGHIAYCQWAAGNQDVSYEPSGCDRKGVS